MGAQWRVHWLKGRCRVPGELNRVPGMPVAMVRQWAFHAARDMVRRRCGPPGWAGGNGHHPGPQLWKRVTMNVAALIIWFSAAAGRLLFRAARLIEHTSGFQRAAATCLPGSVISARACTTLADPAVRCGTGAMR